MKKIIYLSLIISLFTFLSLAKAKTSSGSSYAQKTFKLPEDAQEVSPNVYKLKSVKDNDGREVEGYAFLHKKDNAVRSTKSGKGGSACYTYLASGAKWKTNEAWLVNPANTRGLSDSFVYNSLNSDIASWENAAAANIIGSGSITNADLEADTVSPDGVNEVYFAGIDDPGTIAVTIVWGYLSGPPQMRELTEWDQVYDDVDYDWSTSGESGKMDFNNIATHELGHTVGMGDVYQLSCSEVTEYGYANFGETNKISLEQPDIDGVKALYR